MGRGKAVRKGYRGSNSQVSFRAPHREMLGLIIPESILGTLTGALMQMQGATLSAEQQAEVG
jgi:hypothetical protein